MRLRVGSVILYRSEGDNCCAMEGYHWSAVALWQGGRRRGGATAPLNFGVSENCVLVIKFSSQMPNLGLKPPILGKFKGKIEIWSTCNLLCWKLQLSVGKLQLPAPPTFNPRRCCWSGSNSSLSLDFITLPID